MNSELFATDSVVHIIQIALTPVFLLSGIASLMSVFSTRLGRVSDRMHILTAAIEAGGNRDALLAQIGFLRHRTRMLEIAVSMGTLAGAMTCAATLTLFIGTLREAGAGASLYIFFGLAVIFTFGALVFFLAEVIVTTVGLREKVNRLTEKAQEQRRP